MDWKKWFLAVGSGLLYGYVFAVAPVWMKVGMAIFCVIQVGEGIYKIRSLNRAIAICQRSFANSFAESLEDIDLNPEEREQFENAIQHFYNGDVMAGLKQLNELHFDVKKDCLYYSGQPSLKCAVNPASSCETCPHFEAKSEPAV